MKFTITILLLISAFISCNSDNNNEYESSHGFPDYQISYPHIVDSLNLRDLYDSSLWYIYTWNCDEEYLPKRDSSKSTFFGFLPLKYSDLIIKHDTAEFRFYFLDKDEIILPSMTRNTKELVTGVGFSLKEKKKIYMWSPNGFSVVVKGGNNRFENPLQPEVKRFIIQKRMELDDIFRVFAQKEGVL